MNYDIEHLSIINTNNFEIVNDKDLIIVDKKIAKSIVNLNKKGYTTKFSCEGHFSGVYTYEQNNCNNYFLEQVDSDNHCIVFRKHKNTFDYVSERRNIFIYTKFDKQYDFSNLPKGYVLEQDTITHEYTRS